MKRILLLHGFTFGSFFSMFLLLTPIGILHSQDLSPSIVLGSGLYPHRELKDTIGNYSRERIQFGFTIPVLKKFKIGAESIRFYALFFGVNAQLDNTHISFLPADRLFIKASSSLNGIYRASKKSAWLAKLSVSVFEDEKTVRDISLLRLSGFALYKRSASEDFYYMLGGVYNFSYGQGIPLPVLGIGWNFLNHSALSIILPLSVSYRFGKPGSQYTIFFHPSGGVSSFYNNALYPTASEKIVFRTREFALGIKKRFAISDQWSILTETGLLAGRRIIFSPDFEHKNSANLFESKVQVGPYVSVGLKYRFKADDTPALSNEQVDLDY